nr:MAG TPA: hypothetical protein [Caudoviricetes sp.]
MKITIERFRNPFLMGVEGVLLISPLPTFWVPSDA